MPTRPSPADASVAALRGIGAKGAAALATAGVRSVADLLCTIPRGLVDLRAPLVGQAIVEHARAGGGIVAVAGEVERGSIVPMRGRRAVRVALRSEGVLVELWWFFVAAGARGLSGSIVAIGRPTLDPRKAGVVRIAHPRTTARSESPGALEPIYGLPVANKVVAQATDEVTRAIVAGAIPAAPLDPEGDRSFAELLRAVHAPTEPTDHPRACEALRRRLAFGEAVALVLRRRARTKLEEGLAAVALPPQIDACARVAEAFGFACTEAQRRAATRASALLASRDPQRILLTGDVGTGKTAVVVLAAAQAVAGSAQVAILAPTVILADQYARSLAPLVTALGARVGRMPSAKGRAQFVEAVARGEIDVVVGTHSLASAALAFARLGLVIVDEQHRLGVGQRLALAGKDAAAGVAPHLISVSATPIPRTLALALQGDLVTLHLDERPAGRRLPPVEIRPRAAWNEIEDEIVAAVGRGERCFVVCARIDEDPDDPRLGPGARAREKQLIERLPSAVAAVHGGLDDDRATRAVEAFRDGRVAVLVGTTMLEVGLDVPEATLIVVDGGDRFGLAQLHQLRGRVGRGARPGRCILVHDEPLGETARGRLAALARAEDGLAVARADLALRGPGDLDGHRQSGEASGLRFLDPITDEDLAAEAARWVASHAPDGAIPDDPAYDGLRRLVARLDAALDEDEGALPRRHAG